MSDAEKQTIKMKLVKTPDGIISCGMCYFSCASCFEFIVNACTIDNYHFEPSTPIKIEIVEDNP